MLDDPTASESPLQGGLHDCPAVDSDILTISHVHIEKWLL